MSSFFSNENLLIMLKCDLEIMHTQKDEYLKTLISLSQKLITREGIEIPDDMEGAGAIVMYAAYLYRRRASQDTTMPRMLRWTLNNMLMSQKKGGGTDVDG